MPSASVWATDDAEAKLHLKVKSTVVKNLGRTRKFSPRVKKFKSFHFFDSVVTSNEAPYTTFYDGKNTASAAYFSLASDFK